MPQNQIKTKQVDLIPFPKTLAQSEMPTALSKIWTQVADSIFYNDNHNIEQTSISIYEVELFWSASCSSFWGQSFAVEFSNK